MTASISALRDQIDQLRVSSRRWHEERLDPADFMPAFAGEADGIVEAAERIGADALNQVHAQLDEILIELGYLESGAPVGS